MSDKKIKDEGQVFVEKYRFIREDIFLVVRLDLEWKYTEKKTEIYLENITIDQESGKATNKKRSKDILYAYLETDSKSGEKFLKITDFIDEDLRKENLIIEDFNLIKNHVAKIADSGFDSIRILSENDIKLVKKKNNCSSAGYFLNSLYNFDPKFLQIYLKNIELSLNSDKNYGFSLLLANIIPSFNVIFENNLYLTDKSSKIFNHLAKIINHFIKNNSINTFLYEIMNSFCNLSFRYQPENIISNFLSYIIDYDFDIIKNFFSYINKKFRHNKSKNIRNPDSFGSNGNLWLFKIESIKVFIFILNEFVYEAVCYKNGEVREELLKNNKNCEQRYKNDYEYLINSGFQHQEGHRYCYHNNFSEFFNYILSLNPPAELFLKEPKLVHLLTFQEAEKYLKEILNDSILYNALWDILNGRDNDLSFEIENTFFDFHYESMDDKETKIIPYFYEDDYFFRDYEDFFRCFLQMNPLNKIFKRLKGGNYCEMIARTDISDILNKIDINNIQDQEFTIALINNPNIINHKDFTNFLMRDNKINHLVRIEAITNLRLTSHKKFNEFKTKFFQNPELYKRNIQAIIDNLDDIFIDKNYHKEEEMHHKHYDFILTLTSLNISYQLFHKYSMKYENFNSPSGEKIIEILIDNIKIQKNNGFSIGNTSIEEQIYEIASIIIICVDSIFRGMYSENYIEWMESLHPYHISYFSHQLPYTYSKWSSDFIDSFNKFLSSLYKGEFNKYYKDIKFVERYFFPVIDMICSLEDEIYEKFLHSENLLEFFNKSVESGEPVESICKGLLKILINNLKNEGDKIANGIYCDLIPPSYNIKSKFRPVILCRTFYVFFDFMIDLNKFLEKDSYRKNFGNEISAKLFELGWYHS